MKTWIERKFSGHVSFRMFGRRVTIYGFNAMHVAVNISTRRWGWVCFHPPVYVFGHKWPWYFYVSPNGTPGTATFAIGPGVDRQEKESATLRRQLLGHNYRVDDYNYRDLLDLDSNMRLRLADEP
jgi:hypothetical protein